MTACPLSIGADAQRHASLRRIIWKLYPSRLYSSRISIRQGLVSIYGMGDLGLLSLRSLRFVSVIIGVRFGETFFSAGRMAPSGLRLCRATTCERTNDRPPPAGRAVESRYFRRSKLPDTVAQPKRRRGAGYSDCRRPRQGVETGVGPSSTHLGSASTGPDKGGNATYGTTVP